VEFSIRSCVTDDELGCCEVSNIDFARSVGEMSIRCTKNVAGWTLCGTAVAPLTEFAANDLRLKHLMCRVEKDDGQLLEGLCRAGFVRDNLPETEGAIGDCGRTVMWRLETE